MKKNVLVVIAALILTGLMSCSKEMDDVPEPPVPPVKPRETYEVELNARIANVQAEDSSVVFVSRWNEEQMLLGISLKSNSKVVTRTSPIPYSPFTRFGVIEGFGHENALLKGRLFKGDDSLAIFKVVKEMFWANFCNIRYVTDSLPDVFRYDDFLYGTVKPDSDKVTDIVMKHLTSILDIKLLNKTGTDLAIRNVTVHPADESCIPFFDHMEPYIYAYGNVSQGNNKALSATYEKGWVRKDGTFTVRYPLFLANDSILNGKALIYSVRTDHGVYSYTLTGRVYRGGMRHLEEIIMEGQ